MKQSAPIAARSNTLHKMHHMQAQNRLSAVVSELEKRLGLFADLFPQQWRLVADPSRKKAALCGRRAGKTRACAAYLVETAKRYPRTISVYIALTRLSAKRIIWSMMHELDHKYGLKLQYQITELTIRLPNRSEIWVCGCDDEQQMERLRGNAYKLVIIDEAASFGPHLRPLIEEVLEPAMIETDGTLVLIGTPSVQCWGMFHEATTSPSSMWSSHHWTVLDNPHIPNAKEWLETRMKENQWDAGHPIYRREWLGQWNRDKTGLVVKYNADNIIPSSQLPKLSTMTNVLGVDLGYNDNTAFQVCSSDPSLPRCYLHAGYKTPRMDVTAVAEKIRWYLDTMPIYRVVVDHGGIGKMLCEELKLRFNLPIHEAKKTDKLGAIELLNGDLYSKRVVVVEGEPVLREWDVLMWDKDKPGREDGRFENDLSDASLYSYREAVHWSYLAPKRKPAPGTQEYWDAIEGEIEEETERSLQRHDGVMPWGDD